MEHILMTEQITAYRHHLILEERSAGTVQKYVRDIIAFYRWLAENERKILPEMQETEALSEAQRNAILPEMQETEALPEAQRNAVLPEMQEHEALSEAQRNAILPEMQTAQRQFVTKELMIRYKEMLADRYAVSTANSMLAALNGFFTFLGWHDCRVKPFRQQRRVFRDEERELSKAEYMRLLKTAKANGNERLFYLMQTLCATGIRISELSFITVEAVKCGRAEVSCKGKTRMVLISRELQRVLRGYCKKSGITFGSVFVTTSGKPVNRSNIWTEMKKLCAGAKVDERRVFPHNLRHLFAVSFYKVEKDIAKLADLLGHASIETTRIYIMVSGNEHRRQVERLGLVV